MIEIYISQEQIREKVVELGKKISEDYQGKEILMIVLLKGSFVFAADLARAVDGDVRLDFMKVSSYEGENSTGEVRILKDLDEKINGRHVLVIEDIIDTGLTLTKIMDVLKGRNPASLEICTFLNKPSRRLKEVDVKYSGFEIEDKFVIGYGLDYDQKYRQLPYIGEVVS
ncbi:MAG: hypoxanthine phosphoribosyltransferase [SAR324 cluster bacterium]|uniref:Hypoxanthine phosphoribosyltransferase n=1 Tax=SAR324 cluster bacterium TaxID=2024889 RepID=A0A2A4T679_9DELT|nr:MAG: hypoxanthine phosphoribosyltransferase [SAR324 cluster bacterium]